MEILPYINVYQKAEELGFNSNLNIAVLPRSFDTLTPESNICYEDAIRTVCKLFKQKNLPVSDLSVNKHTYVHLNDAEWLGPIIFFSAATLSNNPDIISIALGILSNYLTDIFKNCIPSRTVSLDIVVEQKMNTEMKRISYKGPISGLGTISEIAARVLDNEPH